ncbi:hypothetical protein [Pseudofrankia inefficax]|uniref:Uncharacterized protein n=1 Tax=Pseudofrankia inefficax (strain DSM 45817 / CECT 9037 / DDB 130130 / EuI1c) TaxID=298654 RepID=E3JCD0_PSEI1|nr:hypothetical protein [Pseudofrankia inefficax]ADP84719.1 hypothetical protein FraEuI1c_6750 [Pseudofrankia inefficax]
MSTLTAARPIRRLALALAGVLILVPVLAGCDLNSVLGKKADCSLYQAKSKSKNATPLLLVLLDLSNNSADTGQQVASALKPYLDNALSDGAYVKLIASGGTTAGLKTFSCFSASTPYLVKRNNTNRQNKDRAAGSVELQTQITNDVQETPISQTGSVTSLLGGVPDDIQAVKAVPGVKIGSVTVLVWSDLLGNGGDQDCMNVESKQASVQVAEAVVSRCFAAQQLSPVKDAKIRFIDVSQGNLTPPQQNLSRYLRGELCRRLSSDCS